MAEGRSQSSQCFRKKNQQVPENLFPRNRTKQACGFRARVIYGDPGNKPLITIFQSAKKGFVNLYSVHINFSLHVVFGHCAVNSARNSSTPNAPRARSSLQKRRRGKSCRHGQLFICCRPGICDFGSTRRVLTASHL